MQQKVKWGVLGTADIARGCTIPGMLLAENCELTAIAGRNPEKATAFKEDFGFRKVYGSYEALLADPEIQAVYIPLPNHLHYPWVLKALQAGKHVLCEKPIGGNAYQTAEMFRIAKAKNLVLMEAFAYLHSPWVKAIKDTLDSGAIGTPMYLESQFLTSDRELTNIRMRRETLGGSVYDLGCYNTSMILWMLGREPAQVQAVAQFTPQKIDSLTTGILTFENGCKAMFTCGMNLTGSQFRRIDRLHIHGTEGTIHSDCAFNQFGELTYTVTTGVLEKTHTVSVPQNYSLEITQMGQCILENARPHVSETFSLQNARTVDRILEQIGY